jgi:putative FmdB family regulatory protein
MPVYQFQCENCGAKCDEFRTFARATNPVLCGCGHLAERVFGAPQVRTEATFQTGVKLGGAQFGDATRDFYLNAARAGGVNPEGKKYDPRIAAFPGDPRAWVSNPDDVRRVLEERNWGCTGDMTVKCEPVEPHKPVGLAPDIVEDLVEDRLAAQFGEDFDKAEGPAVTRAIEDVMNTHVRTE